MANRQAVDAVPIFYVKKLYREMMTARLVGVPHIPRGGSMHLTPDGRLVVAVFGYRR